MSESYAVVVNDTTWMVYFEGCPVTRLGSVMGCMTFETLPGKPSFVTKPKGPIACNNVDLYANGKYLKRIQEGEWYNYDGDELIYKGTLQKWKNTGGEFF